MIIIICTKVQLNCSKPLSVSQKRILHELLALIEALRVWSKCTTQQPKLTRIVREIFQLSFYEISKLLLKTHLLIFLVIKKNNLRRERRRLINQELFEKAIWKNDWCTNVWFVLKYCITMKGSEETLLF